jgi:hypothetical protein
MKVPEKYYDEVFNFKGQWDMPSACGLRIIKREGKTIVIATELYQDNPGTTVAASGKSLALQICGTKNLKIEDIVYVECNPSTDSKLSFYDEEYFEVTFPENGQSVYRKIEGEETLDRRLKK